MENRKVKILLLSTEDRHGAYEALYRIGKALREKYEVLLVVKKRAYKEEWIIQLNNPSKTYFDFILKKIAKKIKAKKRYNIKSSKYVFLDGENEHQQYVSANQILKAIKGFSPDIVIAGMTDKFINTKTLLDIKNATNAEVYQQMVDVFPITGGCHVSWGCEQHQLLCSDCPATERKKEKKIIEENHRNRISNIENGDFKLMTVKGWSIDIADKSASYKGRSIAINYNLADTNLFTNKQRSIAKEAIGFDRDDFVIFAGAFNANSISKGAREFAKSLPLLKNKLELCNKKVKILIVGHNIDDNFYKGVDMDIIKMPFISDYRYLSLTYQASDVVVIPSIEDAGPMMTCEALASGTPVVGFRTGSLFDDGLIQDGIQGYRVAIGDIEGLASSIAKIVKLDEESYEKMRDEARKTALKNASTKAYLEEFEKLIVKKQR